MILETASLVAFVMALCAAPRPVLMFVIVAVLLCTAIVMLPIGIGASFGAFFASDIHNADDLFAYRFWGATGLVLGGGSVMGLKKILFG